MGKEILMFRDTELKKINFTAIRLVFFWGMHILRKC